MVEPTPKPTPTPTPSVTVSKQPKPTINWGGASQSGDNKLGVALGFGTDKYLISEGVEKYVTSLITQNPKLYSRIRTAIKQATGKTYNDPALLGAWLGRTVTNLNNAADPNAKKVSVEDLLRSAAALKVSTSASTQNYPTRQIYQTTPEQIDADINDFAQKKLGRDITDADKQADWYKNLTKSINDMVNQGIVTTVKAVKNPKTGKMEKQVIQAPGFSKEKIASTIESAVEQADPESLARKERIDFTKWLNSKGGVSNG